VIKKNVQIVMDVVVNIEHIIREVR